MIRKRARAKGKANNLNKHATRKGRHWVLNLDNTSTISRHTDASISRRHVMKLLPQHVTSPTISNLDWPRTRLLAHGNSAHSGRSIAAKAPGTIAGRAPQPRKPFHAKRHTFPGRIPNLSLTIRTSCSLPSFFRLSSILPLEGITPRKVRLGQSAPYTAFFTPSIPSTQYEHRVSGTVIGLKAGSPIWELHLGSSDLGFTDAKARTWQTTTTDHQPRNFTSGNKRTISRFGRLVCRVWCVLVQSLASLSNWSLHTLTPRTNLGSTGIFYWQFHKSNRRTSTFYSLD